MSAFGVCGLSSVDFFFEEPVEVVVFPSSPSLAENKLIFRCKSGRRKLAVLAVTSCCDSDSDRASDSVCVAASVPSRPFEVSSKICVMESRETDPRAEYFGDSVEVFRGFLFGEFRGDRSFSSS